MTQVVERAQTAERPQSNISPAAERAPSVALAQPQPAGFNPDQVELIKNTVAMGTSDLELALFLEVCRTTGLNPFQRQIYAVVRKSKTKQGNQWVDTSKMVIQTGIDGYRLIAARSGVHMGTTDAEFGPLTKDGYPESARVIVRKLVHGQVVDFPATARWSEYVQTKAEYKNGSATGVHLVGDMWAKMPHTMLGKCAEALALRKAFPAELSGVYSDVEMQQADSETPQPQQARTVDVMREVADATGATLQQPAPVRSEALLAWEEKIGKVGTRLTEMGLRDPARAIMAQYPAWKTDIAAASAVYAALKLLGERHAEDVAARTAQEDELPAQTNLDIDDGLIPEAETLITPEQRGVLMGHLRRGKLPDSTDARSAFYSWFISDITPGTTTNQLTSEDAEALIGLLSPMDADEIEKTIADFRKELRL